jgi:60S ribosome subunit biogenesis protein NIP7
MFAKLANYTGRSLNQIIQPEGDQRYVFRLLNSRVYYVRESIAALAASISRKSVLSLGTCLGKFTKTGKFRMHITALDVIAPHARYKLWVKPNGEMPFLYGGNIVKAHVGRWSEDCPEHQGVVVYSMGSDIALVGCVLAVRLILIELGVWDSCEINVRCAEAGSNWNGGVSAGRHWGVLAGRRDPLRNMKQSVGDINDCQSRA